MLPALALLAAAVLGRAAYPRLIERRQERRRARGPDGLVIGAAPIDLPREHAPGVLLLHGGGDTPQAFDELAKYLHKQGFAVRAPLLSGHGREISALTTATAAGWYEDVRREFELMRAAHDWVGVVGLSMGGALAIKLAAERKDVGALVLLAPYIAMPGGVRRMALTSRAWGWLVPYFSTRGAASIRDPAAASRARGHGILTPAALRALYDVVNEAVRALPQVRAPALVIQSRDDNRIAPESAEGGFARLGSPQKKFVWTNGAGHVITVDYGYQRVFELTSDWLDEHHARAREPGRGGGTEGSAQRRTDPSSPPVLRPPESGRHPRIIRSGSDRPDSRQDP
ncbi:MAG: alpha/beta fold hydrolase [Gemmatimonadaceae bacterium]